MISLVVLLMMMIIALLAPLLANERPWYMQYHGMNYYPAFTWKKTYYIGNEGGAAEKIQLDITDWKKLNTEKIIYAPIPYSPGKSDYANAGYICPGCEQHFTNAEGHKVAMPLRFRHWLGTGNRGDDLLAGLIHGSRVSLTIGFLSMGIATLIGILLGAFAGFFGDHSLTASRGKIVFTCLGIFFGWFYGFQLPATSFSENILLRLSVSTAIFLFIVFAFSLLGNLAGRIYGLHKKVKVPVDRLISRIIEIMVSLPLFMLMLAVAAVSKPSLTNMMVIIGLTNWTGIARLTRAEMLRIREQEFIQSAKALGFSQTRIMLRHALPNAIAPALISISFGIANAIIIESSLSFLGLGVPQTVTTWGSLLSAGHGNFSAWWLVVFPGLCIFITVTAYNLIGEGLRDALDPKMKS